MSRSRELLRHAALSIAGRMPFRRPRRALCLLYGHTMHPSERDSFRATLRALRQRYEFVSLSEAVRMAQADALPDGRYLAFSFDDGFRDNYELIAPLLDEAGARCCFFVASNFIGCTEDYRQWLLAERLFASGAKQPMTWLMVRELSEAGFEIGAHTADHPNLARMPLDEAVRQMRESQRAVEAQTKTACRWFSWPYGRAEHVSERVLTAACALFEGVFSAQRSSYVREPDRAVFHRDHFEPGWPTSHVIHFASNRKRVTPRSPTFLAFEEEPV